MRLEQGEILGHFKIQSMIGRGGMGEVYRALDVKLEREVAVKVLPVPVANDRERLARCEREAKVLAQLNHHGIASIYGVEDRLRDVCRILAIPISPASHIATAFLDSARAIRAGIMPLN
jgi:serine/threonine protein kinase